MGPTYEQALISIHSRSGVATPLQLVVIGGSPGQPVVWTYTVDGPGVAPAKEQFYRNKQLHA